MAPVMTGDIDSSAGESTTDGSERHEGRSCATCGLGEAEHGIHLIHRFVSITRVEPRSFHDSPAHRRWTDAP